MTASDKGPVKVERAFSDRIIGAAMSELPKERWSCSDDASGTAITLARQRHWSATEVRKALDAPTDQQALVAELVDALRLADTVLRDHACHVGPAIPCLRTPNQCASQCGKSAGDALVAVQDALAKVRGGEGR